MRRILFCVLALVFLLQPFASVQAAEYSVRPFLIDVEAEPRSIITETVLLTNNAEFRKYVVYATVNEISIDKEGEIKKFVSPVMTDRSNTLTSWIEVSRGRIEIPPGEQREVPITFRVSPSAQPGEYHAFIGFVPASNRPTAHNIAMQGEADGVVVKLTISDQRKDSMRITSFAVNRFVTGDDDRDISIEVENMGDLPSAPVGEIIFYDSRGVEVDSVLVNTDSQIIQPGESKVIKSRLPTSDVVGRFKANVSLNYGENQTASLQDTTFFYSIPLYLLIIIIAGILLVTLLVTYLFKRSFLRDEYTDDAEEVTMYIRDGHEPNPMDHDIDLKNKN